MDKPPLHLICDGLPSDDLETDYILRTSSPASLWACDDAEPDQLRLIRLYDQVPDKTAEELGRHYAKIAREVREWYQKYQSEEEDLADA